MVMFRSRNLKFVFCHRRPDRTFKFKDKYFPVCARCTGIYIGVFFMFLLNYFIDLNYDTDLLLLSIILMFPMIVDGVTQLLRWRESYNLLRIATGLPFGIGYGLILIYL